MEKNDMFIIKINSKSELENLIKEMNSKEMHSILVSLRTRQGLKIIEVARRIGIHRETYSNYERGATDIPSMVLRDIAKMYQIPASIILGLGSDDLKFYEL